MPLAQEEVSTAGPSTQPSGAQLPPPSSASEAEAEGDGEGDSESESHSPDATRVLQLVDRKRILRACDVRSPLHSYTALMPALPATTGQMRRGHTAGRGHHMQAMSRVWPSLCLHRACKETVCPLSARTCNGSSLTVSSGPRPGPRKRRRTVTSAGADERAPTASSPQVGDTDVEYRSPSRHLRSYAPSKGRHVERDGSAIESQVGSSTRGGSPGRTAHARRLLLGLPLGMVDELLAVYFTHVHVSHLNPGVTTLTNRTLGLWYSNRSSTSTVPPHRYSSPCSPLPPASRPKSSRPASTETCCFAWPKRVYTTRGPRAASTMCKR